MKTVLRNKLGYYRQQYSINEDYFKTIDDEYKAYILGLWYADGCVHKAKNRNQYVIRLSLTEHDKDILNKIVQHLNYTGPLHYIPKKYMNNGLIGKPLYSICIYNKILFTDLINKGCVPNKSLILDFPSSNIIPHNLLCHFIRGYYDGDGGICFNKCGKRYQIDIVSSCTFIDKLHKFLLNYHNIITKINQRKKEKCKRLEIRKKSEVKKFLEYIYQNLSSESLYLQRKYDKYQEAIYSGLLEYKIKHE